MHNNTSRLRAVFVRLQGTGACRNPGSLGLSLRRLADTNKDNPRRQVRLSFLG